MKKRILLLISLMSILLVFYFGSSTYDYFHSLYQKTFSFDYLALSFFVKTIGYILLGILFYSVFHQLKSNNLANTIILLLFSLYLSLYQLITILLPVLYPIYPFWFNKASGISSYGSLILGYFIIDRFINRLIKT